MLRGVLGERDNTWVYLLLGGLGAGVAYALVAARLSPMLAIAAIIGGIGFVTLVRYPVLGLYLTSAVVPLERMGRFVDDSSQITISLMRVIGMAAFLALLINFIIRRKKFHISPPLFLFGGYCVIAFFGVLKSVDMDGAIRNLAAAIGHILFFFLVTNLVDKRRIAMNMVVIWLLASGGTVLYSSYDWHFGSGTQGGISTEVDPGKGAQKMEDRFSTVWEDRGEKESLEGLALRRSMGTTSHAAVYGINLIMTIPFLLFCLKLPISSRLQALCYLSLGLSLYNVFLTNTRASILLALLIGAICLVRGLFRVSRSFVMASGLALVMVLAVLPGDVYNRILDLSNYTPEKSASLRIRSNYLDAGIRAFADHAVLGIGIGNTEIIPRYFDADTEVPEETSVHNEYLQTLIEVGILGGIFFFSFVFVILRYSFKAAAVFRRYRETEQEYWFMVACQICMISVLIYGLQVDVFHFPLQGWWLVAGITCAMYRMAGEYERRHDGSRVAMDTEAVPV
jgi:hypothetical protein